MPKRTVLDLWASIRPEPEIILKEMGSPKAVPKSLKADSQSGWRRLSGLFGAGKH